MTVRKVVTIHADSVLESAGITHPACRIDIEEQRIYDEDETHWTGLKVTITNGNGPSFVTSPGLVAFDDWTVWRISAFVQYVAQKAHPVIGHIPDIQTELVKALLYMLDIKTRDTRTTPILTITEQGTEMHPAEYAALWGDDKKGARFYNFGRNVGTRIVTADEPSETWHDNHAMCVKFRDWVLREIITVDDSPYTLDDVANLTCLATWLRQRTEQPVVKFTYCDSNTGESVVTLSEEVVAIGSASGDVSDSLRKCIHEVQWHMTGNDLRKFVLEESGYDQNELGDDNDVMLKALWLAACGVRDNPQHYADDVWYATTDNIFGLLEG